MRILVAEDDGVQRRLLEGLLPQWGFEPILVSDGQAAWEILQQEQTAPEMAILDWTIPGFSGPEICQKVRALHRDRYTYLLLLSARGDQGDLLQGLESGADDYLIKPYNPAELRARLNTGRRILALQQELIEAREAMRRQATRDSLTGAWNHAAILEVMQREMVRSHRENRPLSIALVDLDHFKQINDTYGHLAGDQVLRDLVQRMSIALRPNDLIGRVGGEEFLLVLPGCDDAAVRKVCERLHERIRGECFQADGVRIPVTASFGAVVYDRDCYDNDALFRAADAALYRAKAAGGDRIEIAH
jgi:diguanylate cyclase (GGDEF)-like protein